jgi:hypothetical protein
MRFNRHERGERRMPQRRTDIPVLFLAASHALAVPSGTTHPLRTTAGDIPSRRNEAGVPFSVTRLLLMACFLVCAPLASRAADLTDPTVGMSGTIEQRVLPGSELEVIPLAGSDSPIVLRITASYPHGTDWRYDFSFYGLDPGSYDLRDYLRRKDRSTLDGVTEIPVEIRSILPSDGQPKPHEPESRKLPRVGGYKILLIAGGVLWAAGLAVLLFAGRRRKGSESDRESARPPTLADRLRPIVVQAREGKLDKEGQARLERMLLAIWRQRLKVENIAPAEAIRTLRAHEEAGALLRALEDWLHRPGGAAKGDIDIDALLKPYENFRDPGDDPTS